MWIIRGGVVLADGCCCDGFFFQAEDGIRDLVRSRGLGDVYKRQRSMSDLGNAFAQLGAYVLSITEPARRINLSPLNLSLIHI